MNNLKIKKFDESILSKAKLITKGSGFFSTYDLNNGNIIKVVKSVDECFDGTNAMFLYASYNEFIDDLYNKLTKSIDINVSSIVLPNCIYLDDNIPRAYTVPKQRNCMNLSSYLLKNKDLNTIASTIINITKEIRIANKNGINMPDLGNSSNILVNTKNKEIKFIDYDGMQIGKYPSFCISSLISNQVIPFTRDKRMCDMKTGLITNNMDKLSLYALFIFFTTKTFLTDFGPEKYNFVNGVLKLKEKEFYNYTKSIGINDTDLEKELFNIFYDNKINYPDTSIKKLIKTHKFDDIFKNTKFIEKNNMIYY